AAAASPAPSGAGRPRPPVMAAPELSPPGSDQDEVAAQPPGRRPVATIPRYLPRYPGAGARSAGEPRPERRVAGAVSVTAGPRPAEARPPETLDPGVAAIAGPSERGRLDAGPPAAMTATPALATEARLVHDGGPA